MKYKIEYLDNGFFRVEQIGSGLVAMYNGDGTYRHGVRFADTLKALGLDW